MAEGYEKGSRTFEDMVEFCFTSGAKAMTIYAFSIANFQRSDEEVQQVMGLIQRACSRLMEAGGAAECLGIKLRICGKKTLLPTETVQMIERAENTLSSNANGVLNICIAYGSRDEITSSVQTAITKHYHQLSRADKDNLSENSIAGSSEHHRMHRKLLCSPSSQNITVKELDDEMFTAGCPPMDIRVRTSGVHRLSDFMLWQCHEDTEIVILNTNWPDLTVWKFIQGISQWLLRASLSKLVVSVKKSAGIPQIIISCFHVIFLLLIRVWDFVSGYFQIVYNDPAHILRDKEVSLEMIQKDTKGLKKLPTHLSIILHLTDDPNAIDIVVSTVADFMILCISVGIPLLSVYEKTGLLKLHKDKVYDVVVTKLSRHYGIRHHSFNILESGIGKSRTIEKCGPAEFSLLLLSVQDGRERITEISNILGSSISCGESSPEEIDVSKIDKMLRNMLLASLNDDPISAAGHSNTKKMVVFSRRDDRDNNGNTLDRRILDPDMLFIHGSSIHFDGYPPWQLAELEIFCADSGRNGRLTTYRTFLKGLHKYAGADIRMGC